jgi:hypothetical protein
VATAGDDAAQIAEEYRVFARQEARGRSAAYQALAEAVADDAALVSFVASLPYTKRQPNLVDSRARHPVTVDDVLGELARSGLVGSAAVLRAS